MFARPSGTVSDGTGWDTQVANGADCQICWLYAFTGSNPVPTTTFFGPGCVHEGRDAFAGIPG